MRRDELVRLRLTDLDVFGHVAVVLGNTRRERG
jgi:hypothetical protein